ncbi:hypothetical protein FQR65_LT15590 [Abscondita terminalis]|nr:hypothetical protein FQR65_LT15590 [Abscondita terminalis]
MMEYKNKSAEDDPWADFKTWKARNSKKKDFRESNPEEKLEEKKDAASSNNSISETEEDPYEYSSENIEIDNLPSVSNFNAESIKPSSSRIIDYTHPENIEIDNLSSVSNLNKEANHSFKSPSSQIIDRTLPGFSQIVTNDNLVETSLRKGNKKDRCVYCHTDVTNFSRHLFRKHANEESVLTILQLAKGDAQRKIMINYLRKEGNFTIIGEKITRPVQRPTSQQKHDNIHQTDYFPYRISFNGKSDPIICQYAEDYLRKHKRPHIKNVVSNKIRELGRLLIPLQDIFNINSMLEALKPEHFDKVVSAGRIISGYNEATRSFKAPSLALHLKTILLALCASAKTLLLKKNSILGVTNYDVALRNVKGFRELVDTNWKFEMGSLALKDLNEKHSLNPQKLPVTQDIILFRNYTHEIADTCIKRLKENSQDKESFKKLTESALALTIILNRKRIGDVQYTKLESYTKDSTTNTQEECFNVLSESEKELSKHFKRIITVEKGSRSVPILFSKHVQQCMDTLLAVRYKFVPEENSFLFALPGSSAKWVDGSSILRKYAVYCGAKNPGTLTSSRLRKQIATVLQILNLNDTEMEQLATFMGHTRKTHEDFYRLPEELYQTGKIAKLLLVMERGVASENQGKTLDEIDTALEQWNRESEKVNTTTDTTIESAPLKEHPEHLQEQEICGEYVVNEDAELEAVVMSTPQDITENFEENKENASIQNPMQQWNEWNPKKLKQKKHHALQTPCFSGKSRDLLNEKLHQVIKSRAQLVQLQTDLLKKDDKVKQNQLVEEAEFTKRKRQLELELLELKIEEKKLSITLLKQQLMKNNSS